MRRRVGEPGEWEDEDDLKEHLDEVKSTLKDAMGFRLRVTREELKKHFDERMKHHANKAREAREDRDKIIATERARIMAEAYVSRTGVGVPADDPVALERERQEAVSRMEAHVSREVDKLIRRHEAAVEDFDFCRTHMAEPAFNLPLNEASMLELVNKDRADSVA